jgi:hypothetical protein
MMSLSSQTVGPSYAAEAEPQEPPRHPDWLYADDIKALLTGNTITSMSKNGSSRWWKLYLEDGVLSWVNDRGKTAFGTWHIAQDRLCEAWLSSQEKCWGIRITGKAVRYDDPFTGRPYSAAVLQLGDSKNLRTNVTSEVYESLQEPGDSQSELAVVGGGEGELERSEVAANNPTAVEPGSRPLKMRIIHPDPETSENLFGALSGVQLAAANELADLVWNVVKGEIVKDNEIVAYPRTREPSEVQLVIDAWHLIADIEDLGSQRNGGLSFQMTPQQDSYRAGETINLTLRDYEFQHALLFNISPYGEIDVVYPVETDFVGDGTVWPRLILGSPLSISAVAGPPFGANLVVGVVSSAEPRVLLKTLKSGGGPAGITAFLKVLRETEGQVAVSRFHIER